jgi:hypothetical protein
VNASGAVAAECTRSVRWYWGSIDFRAVTFLQGWDLRTGFNEVSRRVIYGWVCMKSSVLCDIPEGGTLHEDRWDNLGSYIFCTSSGGHCAADSVLRIVCHAMCWFSFFPCLLYCFRFSVLFSSPSVYLISSTTLSQFIHLFIYLNSSLVLSLIPLKSPLYSSSIFFLP